MTCADRTAPLSINRRVITNVNSLTVRNLYGATVIPISQPRSVTELVLALQSPVPPSGFKGSCPLMIDRVTPLDIPDPLIRFDSMQS